MASQELLDVVFKADLHSARVLLRNGANANTALPNGWSALMDASMKRNPAMVRLLLAHGADPNAKSEKRETALWYAVINGDTRIARMLLQCGAECEFELGGHSVLMKAAYAEDVPMVSLLLAYGADPNKGNCDRWTALMDASMKGNAEMVSRLLQSKADPNLQSSSGETALWRALVNKHADIARELLIVGAKPAGCMNPRDVMVLATNLNDVSVIDLLIECGVSVNTCQDNGWSPLMNAALNGNAEMVRWLLNHGANPLQRLEDGTTAAHVAAVHGYEDIAQFIISKSSRRNNRVRD